MHLEDTFTNLAGSELSSRMEELIREAGTLLQEGSYDQVRKTLEDTRMRGVSAFRDPYHTEDTYTLLLDQNLRLLWAEATLCADREYQSSSANEARYAASRSLQNLRAIEPVTGVQARYHDKLYNWAFGLCESESR